jgi:hypothetical protein
LRKVFFENFSISKNNIICAELPKYYGIGANGRQGLDLFF